MWTHKYSYKIKHSFNQILTGRIQVSRIFSKAEVLALALKMNNSIKKDACIVEYKLIEVLEK